MTSRYGLEIRAANAGDAAGLAELLQDAPQPVPAACLARRVDALRDGGGIVLLALEWGPPSGVIALHWHPSLAADQPVAQIDCLFVGLDARRRGIGRLLVKSASQAARNAGCGTLALVVGGDASLLAFCAASGFTGAARYLVRPLRREARARD